MEIHISTMSVPTEGTVKKSPRSGWLTITPTNGTRFIAHWMDVSDKHGRLMTHPDFGKSAS